jgi:hypothetical protein
VFPRTKLKHKGSDIGVVIGREKLFNRGRTSEEWKRYKRPVDFYHMATMFACITKVINFLSCVHTNRPLCGTNIFFPFSSDNQVP